MKENWKQEEEGVWWSKKSVRDEQWRYRDRDVLQRLAESFFLKLNETSLLDLASHFNLTLKQQSFETKQNKISRDMQAEKDGEWMR